MGPLDEGLTFVPIPSFGTNKNEGNSYGLIGAFLIANEGGDLTHLIAPQFYYNSNVGLGGMIDARFYPGNQREWRALVQYSGEGERELLFSYRDGAMGNDRDYYLQIYGNWDRSLNARFFGVGPGSSHRAESNYTEDEIVGRLTFGWYLEDDWSVDVTPQYRRYHVDRSHHAVEPDIKAMFPGLEGIEGGATATIRGRVGYDTRDEAVTPTEGTAFSASMEFNEAWDHDGSTPIWRPVLEATHFWNQDDDKAFALVMHGRAAWMIGADDRFPFYELETLGGKRTLRGFGSSRFADRHSAVLNFEERIRLVTMELFDCKADLQLAPFVDVGQVYGSGGGGGWQVNYGLGLRAVLPPHIVGRVDVGFGPEGEAVYMGLDYPF